MNDGNEQDEDGLLARAVRDATRLEPPSAQARERVRAAVHAQWRASLAAPALVAAAVPLRPRWPLALAASLAVALVSGALFWQSARLAGDGTTVAVAEIVRGPVAIESSGLLGPRQAALAARGTVATRQVVATGADGAALLRLGQGLTLRLAANSRLVVAAADDVVLEAGTAYVDADPRFGAQPLRVTTPLGSVRHLGTQYSVSAGANALEVAVREGRVQLSVGATREPLLARAGEALRVGAGGAVARVAIGRDDTRWSWLAAVPVPFELDGATLPAFLDWYARETGLAVSFAEASGPVRAREVTLRGSIAGLSPEAALQVVVASTGLAATRDRSGLVLAFR